ncbi:MAG: hypothetical protein LBE11_03760 [Prevotellaceae bacterium]|jgi:hypothetical protein|nr:hypothetical protein [Prevotellaceae bacterium]
MKRAFLFTIVFVLANFGFVNAQTSYQKELIKDFFESSEVCGLIRFAHPSWCNDVSSIRVVSIYDNVILFRAYFDCSFGDITCDYAVNIDNSGVIKSLYRESCGSSSTKCFGATSAPDKIYSYMSRRNIAFNANHFAAKKQSAIKGKSFYNFSAIELAGCALFALWIDRGYYGKY